MFVSFKKELQQNNMKLAVPNELVEKMGEDLPIGVKYELGDCGEMYITADKIPINISGIIPELTKEQKRILGDSPIMENLMKYAFNSQQEIKFVPKTEGKIIVNGEELNINQIIKLPYHRIDIKKGDWYLIPLNFEKSTICISCEKYERRIEIIQQPYASLHRMIFESLEGETIHVTMVYDNFKNNIQISLSTRIENVKTARDIVETLSIYSSFIDGTGKINGMPIQGKFNETVKLDNNKEIIEFWEKVVEIENKINIKFSPILDPIDYKTARDIERLFQGLVNDHPIVTNEKVSYIKRNVDKATELTKLTVDEVIYIEFESEVDFNVLNEKFKLPALVGLFNTKISKIDEQENQQKVYFTDAREDAKQYSAVKLFVSEAERDEYKAGDHSQIMHEFENAKCIEDYMQ